MVPELSFLSVYLISRLGRVLGRRCRTDEAKVGHSRNGNVFCKWWGSNKFGLFLRPLQSKRVK